MPTATKKPARSAAKSRTAPKEPEALRRFNKSLDSAQDALTHLGKDVGRDVSAGSNRLYTDLKRFVKDARRDSKKLATALQRDVEQAQKRIKKTGTTRAKATPARAKATPKRSSARSATRKAR